MSTQCTISNIFDNFLRFLSPIKINKSALFKEGDTQQDSTDKLVALEFPIEF